MISLIFLLLASLTSSTPAQYIVQLKSNTTLSGAAETSIHTLQESLDACLTTQGITFETTTKFSKVFAGRAMSLNDDDITALQRCPEVGTVWRSRSIPAPLSIAGGPVHPMQFYTHKYTGVDKVRKKGITGQGIKGVDYTHPAFGSCTKIGSENCTFQYGYDFVGDAFTGSGTQYPSTNPFDSCLGHGTHVAGIIAGNDQEGNVLGVAPNVQLGMYRVFGCQGGTTPEIIIAAMRMAYDDGMDVISMSLGGDGGFTDSPEAIVVEELTRKGVIFSIAVGNSGKDGVWVASNPSVAHSATAVTSFDSYQGVRRSFSVNQDPKNPATPPNPATFDGGIAVDLVKTQQGYAASPMCKSPITNVKGKVVFLTRGTCTFYEKSVLLENAGAIGMLVANNRAGDIGPLSPVSQLPIFTISESDGASLANLLSKSTINTIKFASNDILVDLPTGGQISPFASWGLGPDLELKPDFGAPGAYIYSAYPKSLKSYAVLSGTSMATPYIAGCYALYLEEINRAAGVSMKYQTDPVALRERMTVYAAAMDRHADPRAENSIPVARQGGGLVQLDRSISGESGVTPAKLSLSVLPVSDQIFKVSNYGKSAKKYSVRLNSAPSVDVTDSSNPTVMNSSSVAMFSGDGTVFTKILVFVVEAGESKDVYCRVTGDQALVTTVKQFFIGGYIEISVRTLFGQRYMLGRNDYVMSVAFAGMQGTLEKQIVFDTAPGRQQSVSWVRSAGGTSQILAQAGSAITSIQVMDYSLNTDLILLQYRIKVPLQTISIDVVTKSGTVLGNIVRKDKMIRNGNNAANKGAFFTKYNWDCAYVDADGNKQYVDSIEYNVVLSYVTVQVVGRGEGVRGSITFPSIVMQWSEAGRAAYVASIPRK